MKYVFALIIFVVVWLAVITIWIAANGLSLSPSADLCFIVSIGWVFSIGLASFPLAGR